MESYIMKIEENSFRIRSFRKYNLDRFVRLPRISVNLGCYGVYYRNGIQIDRMNTKDEQWKHTYMFNVPEQWAADANMHRINTISQMKINRNRIQIQSCFTLKLSVSDLPNTFPILQLVHSIPYDIQIKWNLTNCSVVLCSQ